MEAGLISIIIPTACEKRREEVLYRAIGSIRTQAGIRTEIIVVVNGQRFDAALLDALRADSGLRVCYVSAGNVSGAQRFGREQVRGEYFGFLDDDDEYLPGALRTRADILTANPTVDVVVSDGWIIRKGERRLLIKDPAAVRESPFLATLDGNWLGSLSAMFRASTIHIDFFDGKTRQFEWTWLTYQLIAAGMEIQVIDTPGFVIHDSPVSASKERSVERSAIHMELLEKIMGMAPPGLAWRVREKIRDSYHEQSVTCLEQGEYARAWLCHMRSLAQPGGLKYMPYTRHLVLSMLRSGGA
jgi:glycosyltransferase involved in cell wall biosynthesis